MTSNTPVPKAEITGVYGTVLKKASKKKLGARTALFHRRRPGSAGPPPA